MKLTDRTLKAIPVSYLQDADGFRALTNREEKIHGRKSFESLRIGRDEAKADDSLITLADAAEARAELPLGWNERITITPLMIAARTIALPYPIAEGTKNCISMATEGSGWLEISKDFDMPDNSTIKWHESIDLMAGDIVTVEYQTKWGDVAQ